MPLPIVAQSEIRAEKLAILFHQLPVSILTNLASAFLLVTFLWPITAHHLLIDWFIALTLITLSRAILLFIWLQRSEKAQDTSQNTWLNLFALGAFAAGLCWGTTGLLLVIENSNLSASLIALAVCGLSAGAANSLSTILRVYFCFSIPAIFLLIWFLFSTETQTGIYLGFAMLLFFVLITFNALRNQTMVRKSLSLQAENSRLIDELNYDKAKSNKLNRSLKNDVGKGTDKLIAEIRERKRNELELVKYREIIDASQDFNSFVDNNYVYQTVNEKYLDIFDKPNEFFIGKSIPDITGKDQFNKKIKPFVNRALTGETVRGEYWIEYPQLGERYVTALYRPHRNESGKVTGVIINVRDITEQQQAKNEQSKSYELYKKAEKLGKLGHWEWDHKTDCMISCSEELASFYEMTVTEAIEFFSQPGSELNVVHPDDRESYNKHMEECEISKQNPDIEYRIVSKSGRERYVHLHGQNILNSEGHIVSSFGSTQDITERANIQYQLSKSHALFKQAEHIGKLGYWEWDEIEHYMTACSEEYARIYDMSVTEVLELAATIEDDVRFMHPDDQQRYIDEELASRINETSFTIDYRIITRAGVTKYVHETSEDVLDNNGKLVRTFGTLQDISERKAMEEKIKLYQSELEIEVARQTEKLATANRELQAFAHSISHDLKAPLRSIEGFSDIIRDEYQGKVLDESGMQYLSEINDGAVRMNSMVNDLLAHASLGQSMSDLTEIDMDSLVQKIQRDLDGHIKSSKTVIEWEGKLGKIMGHRAILEALMQNLLTNAIKYTAPGTQPRIMISMSESDDFYTFTVKDNGIGIEKDHQNRIFGIFQRLHTREEYPGTGIGLAIVMKAVLLHQGRLWLTSETGKGSTFYFTIAKNPTLNSGTDTSHQDSNDLLGSL